MSELISESPSVGLDRYATIIKRRRWVVFWVTLAGVVLSASYLLLSPSLLTATTQVKLNVISTTPFNPQRPDSGLLDAQTEQQMARSSEVLRDAAEVLGGDVTPEGLRRDMSVTLLPDATVARITYAAGDAEAARSGADAIAEAYLAFRSSQADQKRETIIDQLNARRDVLRQQVLDANGEVAKAPKGSPARAQAIADRQTATTELESIAAEVNQLASLDTNGGQVLTNASDNLVYANPKRSLVLGIGLAGGLALGLAAAFIANVADRRVHDGYDVRGAHAGQVFADIDGTWGRVPVADEDRDGVESARERLLATFDPHGGVLAVLDLTRGSLPSDLPVNIAAALSDSHEGIDLVLPEWPLDLVADVALALGGSRKRMASGRVPVLDGRMMLIFSPDNGKSARQPWMRLLQGAHAARQPDRALVVAVPNRAPSSLRLAAGRMSSSTVLVAEKRGTRIGELARLATDLRDVDTVVRGTILVAHRRKLSPMHPPTKAPMNRPVKATAKDPN